MRFGCRSRYISRYKNLKFGFLPFVVASIVAMVFLRRICSSRPGDGEQRGQSLAALTARGKGLDCFQPQPRQPVLRQNKLRIFRFRASTKAQSLRCFSSPHKAVWLCGVPKDGRAGNAPWAALAGCIMPPNLFGHTMSGLHVRQAAVAGVESSRDPFHEL